MSCLKCVLVSRDEIYGRPGFAQCSVCSTVYAATGWVPRSCGSCGLLWGESTHDPCVGRVDGADEVCCGHGVDADAYVSFPDRRLTGEEALSWLRRL